MAVGLETGRHRQFRHRAQRASPAGNCQAETHRPRPAAPMLPGCRRATPGQVDPSTASALTPSVAVLRLGAPDPNRPLLLHRQVRHCREIAWPSVDVSISDLLSACRYEQSLVISVTFRRVALLWGYTQVATAEQNADLRNDEPVAAGRWPSLHRHRVRALRPPAGPAHCGDAPHHPRAPRRMRGDGGKGVEGQSYVGAPDSGRRRQQGNSQSRQGACNGPEERPG